MQFAAAATWRPRATGEAFDAGSRLQPRRCLALTSRPIPDRPGYGSPRNHHDAELRLLSFERMRQGWANFPRHASAADHARRRSARGPSRTQKSEESRQEFRIQMVRGRARGRGTWASCALGDGGAPGCAAQNSACARSACNRSTANGAAAGSKRGACAGLRTAATRARPASCARRSRRCGLPATGSPIASTPAMRASLAQQAGDGAAAQPADDTALNPALDPGRRARCARNRHGAQLRLVVERVQPVCRQLALGVAKTVKVNAQDGMPRATKDCASFRYSRCGPTRVLIPRQTGAAANPARPRRRPLLGMRCGRRRANCGA